MFCKKEFRIECEAEVSNRGAPRNNGTLKLGLGRGVRATFGEQYSFGFVNVYSNFHLVKYVCSVSMVEVSRRAMVSVRQDCVKRAVSSAYNAS